MIGEIMARNTYAVEVQTALAYMEVVDYSREVSEDGIVFDFLFDDEFECDNPF